MTCVVCRPALLQTSSREVCEEHSFEACTYDWDARENVLMVDVHCHENGRGYLLAVSPVVTEAPPMLVTWAEVGDLKCDRDPHRLMRDEIGRVVTWAMRSRDVFEALTQAVNDAKQAARECG